MRVEIIISGTPGVGKTTVAKKLSKDLKIPVIDLNQLLSKEYVIEKDESRDSLVVDVERAVSEIKLPKECIVEGHLAHFLHSKHVFILRCEPKTLYKRLQAKNWPISKVNENVEAEALNIVSEEAHESNKYVYEINTTHKSPLDVVDMIKKGLRGKLKEEKFDFIEYI